MRWLPLLRACGTNAGEPEERPERRWQDALRRAVDGAAGLTAVDGATIITSNHQVLAFGAKISTGDCGLPAWSGFMPRSRSRARRRCIEPGSNSVRDQSPSAAQFAHDQRIDYAGGSQDGRFTVFGWSACERMVHAHRIETLLL